MARLILAIALLLPGCLFQTSDDLEFGTLGLNEDVGPDVVTLFLQDEVSTGNVCQSTPLAGATCDAVLQDCGEDSVCELTVDPRLGRARAVCQETEFEADGITGDLCDETKNRCATGWRCVSNVCRRYCDLETGFGCEEEEFCDDPFPGTHGVCLTECL